MKMTAVKSLAGFLVVNLLLVVIFLSLAKQCPQILNMTVDCQAPVTLVVKECGRAVEFPGGGVAKKHIFLPLGSWDSMTIERMSGDTTSRLMRAELSWFYLFSKVWRDLSRDALCDGKTVLKISDASFAVDFYIILALGGFELVLLGILLFVAYLTRRDGVVRGDCWVSLVISCSLSAFVCFVLPIQVYLANQTSFPFALSALCVELIMRFSAMMVTCTIFLEIARRFYGRGLHAIAVAFLVYEYLETGLLTIGLPKLDGDIDFYKNIFRGIWDLSILVGMCGLTFICRRTAVLWIAPLAVVVLANCMLLDIGREPISSKVDHVKMSTPNSTVVESCVYSTNKNVLVYVLDSLTTSHAVEVFARDPELKRRFEGFLCFTNNVGMYASTLPAVAGMTTGRYCEDVSGLGKFPYEAFGEDTFVYDYVRAGAEVQFMPGSFGFGFATSPCYSSVSTNASEQGELLYQCIKDQQQWNIYSVCRFKLAPFIVKFPVLVLTSFGWNGSNLYSDERWAYERLKNAPESQFAKLVLQFWHTSGSHSPLGIDCNGAADERYFSGYEARVQKTWYVLRQLADLMEQLKSRCLYDKSFIVVCADHGTQPFSRDAQSSAAEKNGRAFPVLWVKTIEAHGPARLMNTPTSHARIRSLLDEELKDEVDEQMATSLLSMDQRVFCTDNGQNIYRFVFGDSLMNPHKEVVNGRDILSMPIVELDCPYRICGDANPPVLFENATKELDTSGRYVNFARPAKIQARMGTPNCDYKVRFVVLLDCTVRMNDSTGCSVRFSDANSESQVYAKKGLDWGAREVSLQMDAMSDANGILTLLCETSERAFIQEICYSAGLRASK